LQDSLDFPEGECYHLKMRLILDRTLGKLAKKLRALGIDTMYFRGGNLAEAARTGAAEGRILLTRSRRLKGGGEGLPHIVIEANDPREQVGEALSKLKVKVEEGEYFSRCILCNELLLAIPKEEAEGRVPDFIYRTYDSFYSCPRCRRIYWPGTHLQRMKKELSSLT